MGKSKKSQKGLDWVTVVALGGVAVALAFSAVNYQRVKRLEERLGDSLGRLEAQTEQVTQAVEGLPSFPASAPAASDPDTETLYTPLTDSDSSELVGVRAVPSEQPDSDRLYFIRTEGLPVRGAANAPVTIAEFSDFQCSFCRKAKPTLARIREVYGDQVRIVWKHLPLEMHKDAPTAHLASVAAANQGLFWEFHDRLFENPGNLKLDALRQHALELGMSMKAFEEDLADPEVRTIVEADMNEAILMALTATPGFFINGRYVRGAMPFEDFARIINDELTKLGEPVPAEARIQP